MISRTQTHFPYESLGKGRKGKRGKVFWERKEEKSEINQGIIAAFCIKPPGGWEQRRGKKKVDQDK
jgi:hypothetical protein